MNRKKPFSAKKKREQLKEKKLRKGTEKASRGDSESNETRVVWEYGKQLPSEKYKLKLESDVPKTNARGESVTGKRISIPEEECVVEIAFEDVHCNNPSEFDIPRKPEWTTSMSKAELHRKEEESFRVFLHNVKQCSGQDQLGYMEHNLDTWRQLWHVVEISDVLLLIADARHPIFHLPPSLLDFILNQSNKPAIVILNKIDLTSSGAVVAWKEYFVEKFPALRVTYFTSFPKEAEMLKLLKTKVLKKPKRKKGGHSAVGEMELLRECELACPSKDFTAWKEQLSHTADVNPKQRSKHRPKTGEAGSTVDGLRADEKFLTLGIIGHPNVGKSAFLNGLIGQKVVSTSRTPGHTKYFQTIFLAENVRLCDCPGLVFPSSASRELQVVCGIYPIAQLRRPYPAVEFIAERLPLDKLLAVNHPRSDDDGVDTASWTALEICEAWALKRGFLTAKAGRPDTYRAANNILRLVVDGRICFCVYPPGFIARQDEFEGSAMASKIAAMQKERMGLKYSSEAWSDEERDSQSEQPVTSSDSDDGSDEDTLDDAAGSSSQTANRFALLME